jgi:hypothetical protein
MILPRLTVGAAPGGLDYLIRLWAEQLVVCSGRGDADEQSDNETE